jgi:DNA-binding response OmpR family regulator
MPHLDIIIVSARDALDDRITGLKSGADRYLVKPVNLTELVANIDAVAHRQSLATMPSSPKPTSVWHLASKSWTLTSPGGAVLALTDREFRLLQILVEAQGQTVAKPIIADKIIGPRFLNRHERLDVLLARLRKKAAASLDTPLPIKTAYQQGYAFTAQAVID